MAEGQATQKEQEDCNSFHFSALNSAVHRQMCDCILDAG